MIEDAIPACTDNAVAIALAAESQKAANPGSALWPGRPDSGVIRGLPQRSSAARPPYSQIPIISPRQGPAGFAFAGKLLYYIGLDTKKNHALGERAIGLAASDRGSPTWRRCTMPS